MSGHAPGHGDAASVTAAGQPRDRRGRYQQHGLHTLKRALLTLGSRALPSARTALGRELQAWRASLVADLGGDPSTAQLALIDLAVRSRLLLDSVDAFLMRMPSLVDKRHRRLWAIVRERAVLVGQLQALLRDLGLDRKPAPAESLSEYVARKDAERAEAADVFTPPNTTATVQPLQPEPPS